MTYKPEVRQDGLTIKKVGDDLVVYDARHRRAHRINKAAALVLQNCDGTRTVRNIALLLPDEMELAEKEASVWLALDDLAKADLLTTTPTPPEGLDLTRRDLIKKAAIVAFALPIVESIFSPGPAQAKSPVLIASNYGGGSCSKGIC